MQQKVVSLCINFSFKEEIMMKMCVVCLLLLLTYVKGLCIEVPRNGEFDIYQELKFLEDSLVSEKYVPYRNLSKLQLRMDRIASSKPYRMLFIGVPLIAGGLIVKAEDDHFRSLRNAYMPSFRYHYDDYLQYLPAVAMLGMKACGVQGRSSWGRMLTSDLFSVITMAATVNLIKSTVNVRRPDGSSNNSFPSGHTATAFMTATMIHKEYGLTRSPWYSVGAYTIAAATGISRQMNNRHWLSDVMVGAGIGILSTELGYFLADLIFKDKGITHQNLSFRNFELNYRPSFVSLYLGYNLMPGNYTLSDGSVFSANTGCNAGIEGAWFWTNHIGIGGRFSASSMPVTIDRILQNDPMDIMSVYVGPYFSYPLSARWLLGSKVIGGYSYMDKCVLPSQTIGSEGRVCVGTGVSCTYLANQYFGVKFFCDYNLSPAFISASRGAGHIFTLGGSANILF